MHHENLAELEAKWLRSDEAATWPKQILQEHIKTSASAVEFAYANTKYQAVTMDAQPKIMLSLIKPDSTVMSNDMQTYEVPEDVDKVELDTELKTELETLSKEVEFNGDDESSGMPSLMVEDSVPSGNTRKKKRVTFAADVVEQIEARGPEMFERRGSRYIPGAYAPRSLAVYYDTSGHNSDSATIQQLKIYVVKFGPDFTNPTTSEEGVVGLHSLWPQIKDFMKAEKDGVLDEETDGLVVYCNHKGEVTGYEFAPVKERKEDEEENQDTLHRWEMAWTSLKQL
jgi:hypothetical protein